MIILPNKVEMFLHPSSLTAGTGIGTIANNVLTCTTSGTFYAHLTQAYGTWEWDFFRGGTNNDIRICLIQSLPSNYLTGQGYMIDIYGNEAIYFYRFNNAAAVDHLGTVTSYYSPSTWYRFRITRTKLGVFTFYIKGGTFTDWTLISTTGGLGTNPITDNTYTTSKYFVADLDVGDNIGIITYYNWIK